MDRLINTAWRAFWVGLGAAAVLIAQGVLAPSGSAMSTSPSDASDTAVRSGDIVPAVTAPPPSRLSRNPFDSVESEEPRRVSRVRDQS